MSKTDMVRAYTESLLEQVLAVEKVRADKDGDYPVRYRSAQYYVRIDGRRADAPVVQVFAIAVAGVAATADLYEAVNDINAQLHFARIFWVREQVLIEADLPGEGLSLSSFTAACETVAMAADYFGPRLVGLFGGKTAFEDEKGDDYEPPTRPPALQAGYL
jgi:hypothetical protein